MLIRRRPPPPPELDLKSVLVNELKRAGCGAAFVQAVTDPANARSLGNASYSTLIRSGVHIVLIGANIDLNEILSNQELLDSWLFEPQRYASAFKDALTEASESPRIPEAARAVLRSENTRLDSTTHLHALLRLASFLFSERLSVGDLTVKEEGDCWRVRFSVEGGDLRGHLADLGLELGARRGYQHFHLTRKPVSVIEDVPPGWTNLEHTAQVVQPSARSSYTESWNYPITYQGRELGELHVGIDTEEEDTHSHTVALDVPKTEAALFESLRILLGA